MDILFSDNEITIIRGSIKHYLNSNTPISNSYLHRTCMEFEPFLYQVSYID